MNNGKHLRILCLEDEPIDLELINATLRHHGFNCELDRVDDRESFNDRLRNGQYDLILADFILPKYDGLSALELARRMRPELPFIFVTGSLGEEMAIETLKRGATDYVLKERLTRLVPSVERALRESADRNERMQSEQERQRLEEQLRQAQKMEAIGLLAGGVAHDFNNLLQVILGHIDLLLTDCANEDPRHRDYAQIQQAASRATELTRRLLALSRRTKIQPIVLNMNELIAELIKMMRRLIGEHIEITFLPGRDLWSIRADAGQVEQVLLNLCINARDAMGEGGSLIIATQNLVVTDEFRMLNGWAEQERYVQLAVSDTGCGMSREVMERMYEPFFTTKESDKGTGLGLATVYGIVTQHAGTIQVDSEPGVGTTFRLFLPASDRIDERHATPQPRRFANGTETVLLAEDDLMVRNLAVRFLQRSGYKVIVAEDGEEAIRRFGENRERIHLALLDLVMPRRSGQDVAEHIRRERPDIPIIYTSGYNLGTVSGGLEELSVMVVSKPYDMQTLLDSVRRALDNPRV